MALFSSSYDNPLLTAAQAGRAARFQSGYTPKAPTEPEEADEPPEQTAPPSVMRAVGNTALSGIGAAGMLLDLPGSSARDLATWLPGGLEPHNPLDQWTDWFGVRADQNRIEGRDLLRSGGVAGKKDTWGNFASGLALEMAIDPTTYMGVGAVSKIGKAFEATGLLGGAARKQLLKDIAATSGKKGFKPGSSWKYQLTGKRILDHLSTVRDNAAKTAGDQIKGKRKGKWFNSVDELGEASDDAWALVDEGGEYKVYRHKVSEGAEKGNWTIDKDATEVFKQKLPPSASQITYRRTREIAEAKYRSLYKDGWEAALENDPLYNMVSVRVPFTNINKPLVKASNPTSWWDKRMEQAEAVEEATKKKTPKNAKPGKDKPVKADDIVKQAEDGQGGAISPPAATQAPVQAAAAAAVITPEMLTKLKEAQFTDDEIAGMSYNDAVEALDDGVGYGMPKAEGAAPTIKADDKMSPPATQAPDTSERSAGNTFSPIAKALSVDETTARGKRVREIFDARGESETLANVPIMDAAIKTMAKWRNTTPEAMWGSIAIKQFADEAELNKVVEDAGGIEKLFQKKSATPNEAAARGMLLSDDSKHLIALFKDADATTVMHEFSHLSRKYLPSKLQEQAKAGVEKILKQGAIDPQTGKWTDAAEEAFAKAWERYLIKGESPAGTGLTKVFRKIKQLLENIYPDMQKAGIAINRDLKNVFDELLGKKPRPSRAKTPVTDEIGGMAKEAVQEDPLTPESTASIPQDLGDALPPVNALSEAAGRGRTAGGDVAPRGLGAFARKPKAAVDDKMSPTPDTPAPNALQKKATGPTAVVQEMLRTELPGAIQAALARGDVAEGGAALARREVDAILNKIRSTVNVAPQQREGIVAQLLNNPKYQPLLAKADEIASTRGDVDAPMAAVETPVKPLAEGVESGVVDKEVADHIARMSKQYGNFADTVESGVGNEIADMVTKRPDITKEDILKQVSGIARKQYAQAIEADKKAGMRGVSADANLNRMQDSKEGVSAVEGLAARAQADSASKAQATLKEMASYLPERDQKIIDLKMSAENLTNAEIAARLGIKESTLKAAWTRTQDKLKAIAGVDIEKERLAQELAQAGDTAKAAELQKEITAIEKQRELLLKSNPTVGELPPMEKLYQSAVPNADEAALAPKKKKAAKKAYAGAPKEWLDRVLDLMDKGEHLFFNNPIMRRAAALFDPDVLGGITEEGQEVGRIQSEAWRNAIFEFRQLMTPIVRTIGQTGVLDQYRLLDEFKALGKKEARKATNNVLNQRHSEIVRFLEERGKSAAISLDDTVFTDKAIREELEEQLRLMRDVMPDELKRDALAGLSTPDVNDEYVNYFARQQYRGYSKGAAKVRGEKVVETNAGYQTSRRKWTKNIKDGRSVIDDLSVDEKISGTYWDRPVLGQKEDKVELAKNVAYLKEKYLDRILGENDFEVKDGVRKVNKRGERKLRAVAKNVARMPKFHVEDQIPFYGRNFLHDFARRVEEGYARRGVALAAQDIAARNTGVGQEYALKDFFDSAGLTNYTAYTNTFARMGLTKEYKEYLAEATSKLNERLDKLGEGKSLKVPELGLISKKDGQLVARKGGNYVPLADQSLENFVQRYQKTAQKFAEKKQLGVNKAIYDEANRFLTPWKKPAEVGEFMRVMNTVMNQFKTHVTIPFPAFHGRNLISGQIQNFFYGASDPTARGPMRYAKPILQAYQMRKGGVVRGLYKELPETIRADIDRMYNTIENEDGRATRWAADQVFRFGLTGDKQGYAAERIGDSASSLLSQLPGAAPPKGALGLFRKEVPGTTWLDRLNPAHVTGGGRPVRVPIDKSPAGQLAAKASPQQNRWSWKWNDTDVKKEWEWQPYEESTFAPVRIGEDLAMVTEDVNRIAPFLAFIKQGLDPKVAAERTQTIQIDYSRLTEFDKVMRNIAPFYTFTKNIIPLTFRDLITNPGGKQAWAIRATTRAQGSDETPVPENILRSTSIPLGETETGAKRYLTGLGLPYEDALSFTGFLRGDVQGAAGELVSRMRPEIQALGELATGRSLFFDKPLGDLDPPMGRLASNIKQTLTGGERETGQAEPLLGMSGVEWLVGKTPASRYLGTVNSLFDQRRGLANKAVTSLTGVRETMVEPWQVEKLSIDRASNLLKEYGARNFETTYLPSYAEGRLSEGQKQEVDSIQEFIKNVRAESRRKKKEAEAAAAALAEPSA